MDGHPVAVGGHEGHAAGLGVDQDAGQHRQLGVAAHGEAYGVEGGGQDGAGQGHGGHRVLLRVEKGVNAGELAAGIGQAVFEAAQVPVQQLVRGRPVGAEHRDDGGHRHAHPAQAGDQAGLVDLRLAVPPVAVLRIDQSRHEHARAVVEPQRAHAEPAGPCGLADAPHVALHTPERCCLDQVEGQVVG